VSNTDITTNKTTEFSNKLNSALRYGGTAAGTGFTLLAVLSLLSPDQVVQLKGDVETLKTSIITGYGALLNMWIVLGPVAIGVAAKLGWNSSGAQAMARKLLSIASNDADPKSMQAKVELVNAAASKAIGSEGVINPALAADPNTATNVVAAPSDIPKA
jgi:hypothetical protein